MDSNIRELRWIGALALAVGPVLQAYSFAAEEGASWPMVLLGATALGVVPGVLLGRRAQRPWLGLLAGWVGAAVVGLAPDRLLNGPPPPDTFIDFGVALPLRDGFLLAAAISLLLARLGPRVRDRDSAA